MRRFIKIRFPGAEEILDINNTYYNSYKECRSLGILAKKEIEEYIISNNLFTEQEEEALLNIEGGPASKYRKIRTFEDESMERRFLESKMIEIMLGYRIIDLRNLNTEPDMQDIPEDSIHRDISSKKSTYTKYSAEAIAEVNKNYKLVYYCCFDRNTDKRIWDSFEEFMNEKNRLAVIVILREVCSFFSGFHQTVLRKIARNVMWRTKWISATKTGSPIFPGNVGEWDMNKSMLCYWSNFYDSVYAGHERPEEYVINDDEFLDNWLENKSKGAGAAQESPDKDTIRGVFKPKINPIKKKK